MSSLPRNNQISGPLITFDAINLEFGDQVIFREARFTLEAGERVCLVGRNGAGKSTMLRLITGEIEPDAGEVRHQGDIQIAQLQQALPEAEDTSVRAFVAGGLDEHLRLIQQYRDLTANDVDAAGLRELEGLQRRIEVHGGWDAEIQVDAMITTLDLPANALLGELSGGWQRRVGLAKALVSKPDLLLLDEPTNHLDLAAIQYLERRVRAFDGTILFITHDRAFLQALATRIVDIDRGQLKSWPGDYSTYLRRKEQALDEEARHNALFDKKLAEEESWIRQGIKARRTRNEGRVRALNLMRAVQAARLKPDGKTRIPVQDAEQSSRRVIRARNISYSFGTNRVIDRFSINIMRGDRIGLIGNNGVGKSTLLRLLIDGLSPQSGTLKLGENLEIGYFDQLRQQLDPEKTVAETVGDGRDYISINGKDRHVIGYLRGFLFTAKRAMTPVGFLSGGECNRVILAKLFSEPTNLLVLDEPTSDLDVETLEVLEAQLSEYQGTIIVVSHDRAFLDNVVTSTLVFESSGAIKRYAGGYADWLRQGQHLAATDEADKRISVRSDEAVPDARRANRQSTKLSYKFQLELDQLPDRIESLEREITELEARADEPGFYAQGYDSVQPVLEVIEARRNDLDIAMNRWGELEAMQTDLSDPGRL